MMKIIINIILIFLFIPLQLNAQDTFREIIAEGNEAYDEGRYKDAISSYKSVIDSGYSSAALYYNLGNAFFKQNDMPSAILYYEKARKLAPKDKDILFNLKIANNRIIDKIEEVPDLFYIKWWKSFVLIFPPDTWAKISLGLFIGIFLLAAIFILSRTVALKRFSFWSGIVVILLTIISFIVSFQSYNKFMKEREAIIFTPTVTVKSSPNPNSVDLFVVHEGTKVTILDSLDSWTEIKIANGSVGWLPSETFRKI